MFKNLGPQDHSHHDFQNNRTTDGMKKHISEGPLQKTNVRPRDGNLCTGYLQI